MRVILTIKESSHGLWCICNGATTLFDGLPFAYSIRLARRLAREEHDASGCLACVELACAEFTIDLVRYVDSSASAHDEAA